MFAMIESWRESDMSQRAWCNQNNLSLSTFKYWQKIYDCSQRQSKSGFIELRTPAQTTRHGSGMIICYPNGVRLEIDAASSNPDLLKSLITIF